MVMNRWNRDDGRTCLGIGGGGDPQFTLGAAHSHAVFQPVGHAGVEGVRAE